ncbi:C40 family peptidase [Corynebacterium doosanense]|uniref:Endopeptidase n=1 Tax=Corynebacterium doosanense CAU 212 = DSM 45436 TaxID=558173 RepID=A0A097IH83_9CORY|nr:C40 family peptidase [Corynebacterium doosanense]AIT61484.1 endopeptidase [Corynebacterium doosanense CAU 212 = DSM 45436]
MAKHRSQNAGTTRRIAAASAAVATMSVLTPGIASAAEVAVPGTGFGVEVQGVENIPGVANIPGVEQYIPSLAGQAAPAVEAFTAAAAPVTAAAPTSGNQAVVDAVRSKVGAPYVYGAAGPSAFDCSGLTSWAYAQSGKTIPRTSQAQAAAGQQVAISDLQPGDIIAYYGGASHVAIYTGNGMMIDALNSGSPVTERPIDYMPIHSAFRF